MALPRHLTSSALTSHARVYCAAFPHQVPPIRLPSSVPWAPASRPARAASSLVTAAKAKGATVQEGEPPEGRIVETELRHEAERSYMAYAMSVIVGRALPDVRDGLKPVQRRILFAMDSLGLEPSKPFRKCARVVGEVLGKYHPHGDASVYDALVRMAQDFSMRAPLVSGHGNFGSLDNDPPAAMRYTECRLQALAAAALLADLESNTVDFADNFDGSQQEPVVLPARVPLLLVNGAGGIAVGIATKIPPHNLREVVAALEALAGKPDISVKELMKHVPAPDFPTGAEVLLNEGVHDAYSQGRGSITMRATSHIEEAPEAKRKAGGRSLVVITELPYQVYKADIVESIAKLVEDGTITGVSDVRDESDRTGVRVVVEVKRGSNAQLVQNALFKHTSLQTRFSCNMVALVDGTPRSLTLKDFLQHFLDFRSAVVVRRGQHDLERARTRLHLVQGLLVVFADLDGVLATIRKASSTADAAAVLQERFGLSKEQSAGVLAMSLGRLTGLEEEKLRGEREELEARIRDLADLVGSRARVVSVVLQEAKEIAAKYGTPRRSALMQGDTGEILATDVIPNDPCFIMYSRKGYIKRMPADAFALQNRGTRGRQGGRMREDDALDSMLSAHAHDPIMIFTQDGVVRSLPAYQVPEASRASGGTALAQILPVGKSHMIATMMVLPPDIEGGYLLLLTEQGYIKKTALSQFDNLHGTVRTRSAIKLRAGDRLLAVAQCCDDSEVVLCASCGTAIRFTATQDQLREMGRMHGGLMAMKLNPGSRIVGMGVITRAIMDSNPLLLVDSEEDEAEDVCGPWLLLVSAQGQGKRLPLSAIKSQRRGGKGMRVMKFREGDELAALAVVEGDSSQEIIVGTKNGIVNRTSMESAPAKKTRTTMGVRLVKLKEGDEVQAIALAPPESAA